MAGGTWEPKKVGFPSVAPCVLRANILSYLTYFCPNSAPNCLFLAEPQGQIFLAECFTPLLRGEGVSSLTPHSTPSLAAGGFWTTHPHTW